jgi:glutathione S-transferase
MLETREGGCHCGRVRFRAPVDLDRLQNPVADAVRRRLDGVAHWLGDRDYLEGEFSAGDLLMATVLRIPRTTDMVSAIPTLKAYLIRCEAGPAFQRALAAQMETFRHNESVHQSPA